MGVDVIDVPRREPRGVKGVHHGPDCPAPFGMRRGEMIRVAGGPVSRHLRQDMRASLAGVFQLLEHEDPGALRHDEPVPVAVERAACLVRFVVSGADGLQGAETRVAQPGKRSLGSAREHHLRVPVTDQPPGVTEGVIRRRARRDHAAARAEGLQADGDVPGGLVGNHHGNEQGMDGLGALLENFAALRFSSVSMPPMPFPG